MLSVACCCVRLSCSVFERDGVQVVADSVSMGFLKGAVVEFEDSLMRSAFQVGVSYSVNMQFTRRTAPVLFNDSH
jgi:Fe-S cluster assembly iron-binding protein IscA